MTKRDLQAEQAANYREICRLLGRDDIEDRAVEDVEDLIIQRQRLYDYTAEYREVVNETCGTGDEKHCSCVPHLRREIAELKDRRDSNE